MCKIMEKYLIQQLVELVKEGLLKVADAARKTNIDYFAPAAPPIRG